MQIFALLRLLLILSGNRFVELYTKELKWHNFFKKIS